MTRSPWIAVAVAGGSAATLPLIAGAVSKIEEDSHWAIVAALAMGTLAAVPVAWWAHRRDRLRGIASRAVVLGLAITFCGFVGVVGTDVTDMSNIGELVVAGVVMLVGACLFGTAIAVLLASRLLPPDTPTPLPGRGRFVLIAMGVLLAVISVAVIAATRDGDAEVWTPTTLPPRSAPPTITTPPTVTAPPTPPGCPEGTPSTLTGAGAMVGRWKWSCGAPLPAPPDVVGFEFRADGTWQYAGTRRASCRGPDVGSGHHSSASPQVSSAAR